MGQAPQAWCRDGLHECKELTVWHGRSHDADGGCRDSLLPPPRPPPPGAEWMLAGLPRELTEALRETGQWAALRRRPWLSPPALRGLQRGLQQCQLRQLAERYREAEAPDECTYDLPVVVPWKELDPDHVISSGQVFRLPDMPKDKLVHLRRVGLTALRQNKVAVALLAGGANLRLGGGEIPIGCVRKALRLRSGKSLLQLLCERVRRIAVLCCTAAAAESPAKPRTGKTGSIPQPGEGGGGEKRGALRASIPVFVMTSRLTHRTVVEHFESNAYFGLPVRDVFFFEQPVSAVVDDAGQLLPQSLGGDFAHAPGGTGQALRALAGSSGLERMRDRGVECLHVLGAENLLAKVCDPVFIGFCRDVEVDCACKVAERMDAAEDLELFCVRQSPVSTAYADVEEAACGLEPGEAPIELLHRRAQSGELSCFGSINSVYMTVTYIEEVLGRRIRAHMVSRPMPFLDFHPEPVEQSAPEDEPREAGPGAATVAGAAGPLAASPPAKRQRPPGGVAPGCWPAETNSQDLASQRALLVAAAEVRAQRSACPPLGGESGLDCDPDAAWRCDVHLDCTGPMAVVRVRGARPGPLALPRSLAGPGGDAEAAAASVAAAAAAAAEAEGVPAAAVGARERLRCSLVVPGRPNAWVLENSILDYFAFTDRAVALQVPRPSEFAPVRDVQGLHSAEDARRALHSLHCSWVQRVGGSVAHDGYKSDAILEVSPLLSYEGEGLESQSILSLGPLRLPAHLASPEEVEEDDGEDGSCNVADEAVEGLDTRPFYLQEYPLRLEVSCSHTPRFLHGGAAADPNGEAAEEARPGCTEQQPPALQAQAAGVEVTGDEASSQEVRLAMARARLRDPDTPRC